MLDTERLNKICESIISEYKALLDEYRNLSISDEDHVEKMVYILKECYSKMIYLTNIICTHSIEIYLDPLDAQMRLEKKAKAFINSYINQQREDGFKDHLINVIQFSNDLGFIWDYIYAKNEKLKRM